MFYKFVRYGLEYNEEKMKDKKLIIKDIQGEIYVISQDGSIKMLKDGDEIYAGEKIFTKNLDAKITLEDGEQVNLNAHQSINLDEILKISAKGAEEQSDHSNGFGASEGISLSVASFVTSGHSANIHQIYNQHRSLEPNVSSAQSSELKSVSGASSTLVEKSGGAAEPKEEPFIDSTNKIMVVNKGLDSNISSAQSSELKSVSGASSTLVEKSGGAAEPKEEPFIDTINVLNVTNRGLDADMWFYNIARNNNKEIDEHLNNKYAYEEWMDKHNISASSTFSELTWRTGTAYNPLYFKRQGTNEDLKKYKILSDPELKPEELIRIGQDPRAKYDVDRLGNSFGSYGLPKKSNGHYLLNESKPSGSDGLILKAEGWMHIKDYTLFKEFAFYEVKSREIIKFIFNDTAIYNRGFTTAKDIDEVGVNFVKMNELHLNNNGFYKVSFEVVDDTPYMAKNVSTKFTGTSEDEKYTFEKMGITLVSNSYMEALAQNHLATKESDTFYKAKETNGVRFGDNASDFDKPFDLKFEGTKDVGSNDDDKFIFNSHDIDAKGGIDTLVFTQNVDLTKIEELDKRLESFERIELDGTKAVKLKLNGQNISDMIDSNPTKGPDGLESLNTILKISGDSDDVVQLVGNFVKATNGEVAALNAKNSVIGADDNKLNEVGGEAVNQIYKGENNAGQTFFVEIDKNVHVEVM